MKKNHTSGWIFILLFAFTFSCSVQKRHYTKGYHFSWNKSRTTPAKAAAAPVAKHPEAVSSSTPIENKAPAADNIKEQERAPVLASGVRKEPGALPVNKTGPAKMRQAEKIARAVTKLEALTNQSFFLPEQPKPDETDAVIALVFSISGFVILGLIGSIVGLVLANKARRRIAADPGKYGGQDLADLARIIALVGIILWCVLVVFLLFFFLFLFSIAA